jgi:hypothetical protein
MKNYWPPAKEDHQIVIPQGNDAPPSITNPSGKTRLLTAFCFAMQKSYAIPRSERASTFVAG